MSVQNFRKVALSIVIIVLSLALISQADSGDNSIERIHSDVDESSCICGLNRDILDRLERIIKKSQENDSSQCTSPTQTSNASPNSSDDRPSQNQDRTPPTPTTTIWGGEWSTGSSNLDQVPYQNYRPTSSQSSGYGGGQAQSSGQQNQKGDRLPNQLTNEFQLQLGALQQSGYQMRPPTSSWSSNNNQQRPISSSWFGHDGNMQPSTDDHESQSQTNDDDVQHTGWKSPQGNDQQFSNSNSNQEQQQQPKKPIDSGFLQGIIGSGADSELAKLNQSQQVDSSDIQNALESTIPNLVSNIFSNIQNITIQTENGGKYPIQGSAINGNSESGNGNVLTSIDGSSVQLHGNTTEQITAQGEELFMQWIEHQIHTLKLTASMANYIRKSALNLFRRIVRQYVERVERLGGRVEDNVRQATQVALNNTQNLIAYILRNYINFAGGLMQIIGESVSRFGKRIDSTGETIANVNLNPFDIVSDVIDSLPNPSHYSDYFRAFGKYLMGESSDNSDNHNKDSNQDQQTSSATPPERPKGLFSKAMGSLSKTLGAWIG